MADRERRTGKGGQEKADRKRCVENGASCFLRLGKCLSLHEFVFMFRDEGKTDHMGSSEEEGGGADA